MVGLLILFSGCKTSYQAVAKTDFLETYIDSMMNNALEKHFFPGAQVIVGNAESIIFEKNYGYLDYEHSVKVSSDVVYDIASMTKVLATTLVTMQAVGEHKIKIKDQLGHKVGRFKNSPLANLTLFELLTHTSGLPSGILFYQKLLKTSDFSDFLNKEQTLHYNKPFDTKFVSSKIEFNTVFVSEKPESNYTRVANKLWLNPKFYEVVFDTIAKAPIKNRGHLRYSDLNFVLIQQMVESVTHKKLELAANQLFAKLEVANMGFNPLKWTTKDKIAPTEIDYLFRKDTIQGYVHDETAAIFGGVAGNAGLFANAKSIAVICQMLLKQGSYKGDKIIKANVIRNFTKSHLIKEGIFRGLGFDQRQRDAFFESEQFGHTGFTGTFFFINPSNKRFLIILTNRVHPTRSNRLMYTDSFMPKIWRQVNK
ncbi:MAG: serine hydrolase domain-containing protein [Flavobacterium sp.]